MVIIDWNERWANEFARIFPKVHIQFGCIIVDRNQVTLCEEFQWDEVIPRHLEEIPDYDIDADMSVRRDQILRIRSKISEVQNEMKREKTLSRKIFHKVNLSLIENLQCTEMELRAELIQAEAALKSCEVGAYATHWVGGGTQHVTKYVERASWNLDSSSDAAKWFTPDVDENHERKRYSTLSEEGRRAVSPSVIMKLPKAKNVSVLHAILMDDQDKLDRINQDSEKNHSEGGKIQVFIDDVRDSEQVKVIGGTLEDCLLK